MQAEDVGEVVRPGAGSLEVVTPEGRRVVPPGSVFVIGRDEAADLQIVDPQVSRRHLVLRSGPHGGWEAVDVSRNGSFVGGRRLTRAPVHGSLAVSLGAEPGAPVVRLAEVSPSPDAAPSSPPQPAGPAASWAAERSARQGRLSAVHDLRTRSLRLTVGRDEANDLVIADLLASRRHAELRREGDQWLLVDLGSANGTFVNGRRVKRAVLGSDDVVGIGHALLHLEGDRLVEHVDAGDVSFRAEGLVVRTPKGKTLLRDVGFGLESKSLLAVVGPSGAGKSTLLRALTGFRPAEEGRVEYAGRDLYADYDELRHRIGLVPQDDILHPQLTVRRALQYAAELRFPDDVGAAERAQRVEEVVAELNLTAQADQTIDSLSGGQRKRTSVALELLTRPSLLFLDEPTSGLDPGLDKQVMQTLRGLADGGRTVVVVTHSVANLDLCDRLLLLAPGGSVAYFGPPQEALGYFCSSCSSNTPRRTGRTASAAPPSGRATSAAPPRRPGKQSSSGPRRAPPRLGSSRCDGSSRSCAAATSR